MTDRGPYDLGRTVVDARKKEPRVEPVSEQGRVFANLVAEFPVPDRRQFLGNRHHLERRREYKGLSFRFRNAYVAQDGSSMVKAFRIILNYELPHL